MLFPLGFPALCLPLDFSNEGERYYNGHSGVSCINSVICPFHKLPVLSNQKSKHREQDQLGWKLEYLYYHSDRGVFFR